MIEHMDHPVEGVVPVLASPLRFDGSRPPIRRAPPLLGEHNDEVLGRSRVER
jgi:formyl-CoA transferase